MTDFKVLDAILNIINENLERKEGARETILRLTRKIVKFSSKAIKAVHNRNFKESDELLEETRKTLKLLDEELKKYPIFASWGTVIQAYQEFVEAYIFRYFIEGWDEKKMPPPEVLDVPDLAYVLGLGDLVGELRRYCLDRLRQKDLAEAERALRFSNAVFEGLMELNQFQEAIIPGLRRKCDIARMIIEKTRGDLTNASARIGLETQIKDLLKRLSKEKGFE